MTAPDPWGLVIDTSRLCGYGANWYERWRDRQDPARFTDSGERVHAACSDSQHAAWLRDHAITQGADPRALSVARISDFLNQSPELPGTVAPPTVPGADPALSPSPQASAGGGPQEWPAKAPGTRGAPVRGARGTSSSPQPPADPVADGSGTREGPGTDLRRRAGARPAQDPAGGAREKAAALPAGTTPLSGQDARDAWQAAQSRRSAGQRRARSGKRAAPATGPGMVRKAPPGGGDEAA